MTTYSILRQSPRVLIVENDPRTRESLQALISHWGYKPVTAEGEGEIITTDAIRKAREQRCQIAIVDMRLIDDFDINDRSGLELVQKLKPAMSIVTSAYGDEEVVSESLEERGASAFVGKQRGPKILKDKLERVIQTICAIQKELTIEPEDILEHISNTLCKDVPIEYHDQIKDTLFQLFPNAQKLHLERMGGSTETLSYSTVPRPRSAILLVYEDNKQPVIVKLARAHKMDVEINRFQDHIQGHLKGHFHPHISNPVILWDIGGAVYTSLGSTNSHTFSKFYNEASFAEIEHSLTHFFCDSWSPLYGEQKKCEKVSLFKEYCKVWGDEWYQRICRFNPPDLQDVMKADIIKGILPIDPITWFKESISDNVPEDKSIVSKTALAVTHGDLHGDNLLIDENHNAWVIDFERSGEGHILQDFVELEGDILNRLISSNKNLPSFHKLCIKISQDKEIREFDNCDFFGNPEVEKALQTISLLRRLARQCTDISDARQYLLGLLFNTLFRATITGDTAFKLSQQRALMLASIICHRLDHWDEPWPPKKWTNL